MKAVDSVRDLISEDNPSLTFFSELEKSITIKASGRKQNAEEIEEKQTSKKRLAKENLRYPLQREMKQVRSQSKRKLFHQQKRKALWIIITLRWESQMVVVMKKS